MNPGEEVRSTLPSALYDWLRRTPSTAWQMLLQERVAWAQIRSRFNCFSPLLDHPYQDSTWSHVQHPPRSP